jgi:hypothetical protein
MFTFHLHAEFEVPSSNGSFLMQLPHYCLIVHKAFRVDSFMFSEGMLLYTVSESGFTCN